MESVGETVSVGSDCYNGTLHLLSDRVPCPNANPKVPGALVLVRIAPTLRVVFAI